MSIRNFICSVSDFFFPPLCLLCKEFLLPGIEQYFCKKCLNNFCFNYGPQCPQCGRPFTSEAGDDHLCSRCFAWKPFFNKAFSIGLYEGGLRKAIHLLKYSNRSLLAFPLGLILSRHGAKILNTQDYDVVIPVPLHPKRLRQRGFNQSLILARQIGKAWNVTVDPTGLQRVRWTDPQTQLSERERIRNVRGAFAYKGKDLTKITALLIDDVYTSGSTVNECAKALKIYGAGRVDVFTLARTR